MSKNKIEVLLLLLREREMKKLDMPRHAWPTTASDLYFPTRLRSCGLCSYVKYKSFPSPLFALHHPTGKRCHSSIGLNQKLFPFSKLVNGKTEEKKLPPRNSKASVLLPKLLVSLCSLGIFVAPCPLLPPLRRTTVKI